MKCQAKVALVLLSVVIMVAGAQSAPEGQGRAKETQARGYWIDKSTSLMWAGKDNGRDVNWHKATDYCRNFRLAGYSNWRLASIDELEGIYDKSAEAPGRDGQGASTWHVKGSLFLTGLEWSSTPRTDDRGQPDGFAWYFDFINGRRNDNDASRFSGRFADYGMRGLCVRRSAE